MKREKYRAEVIGEWEFIHLFNDFEFFTLQNAFRLLEPLERSTNQTTVQYRNLTNIFSCVKLTSSMIATYLIQFIGYWEFPSSR